MMQYGKFRKLKKEIGIEILVVSKLVTCLNRIFFQDDELCLLKMHEIIHVAM